MKAPCKFEEEKKKAAHLNVCKNNIVLTSQEHHVPKMVCSVEEGVYLHGLTWTEGVLELTRLLQHPAGLLCKVPPACHGLCGNFFKLVSLCATLDP